MPDTTKKFRMKKKPTKPERVLNQRETAYIYLSTSVETILDTIKKYSIPLTGSVYVESGSDCYHCGGGTPSDLTFEWWVIESDEDFQKRLDEYEKELQDYILWTELNFDLIQQEQDKKKAVEVGRQNKKISDLVDKAKLLKEQLKEHDIDISNL